MRARCAQSLCMKIHAKQCTCVLLKTAVRNTDTRNYVVALLGVYFTYCALRVAHNARRISDLAVRKRNGIPVMAENPGVGLVLCIYNLSIHVPIATLVLIPGMYVIEKYKDDSVTM